MCTMRYYCGVADEAAAMFSSVNEGRSTIPLHKKRKELSDIPTTPYIFSPNTKIKMEELQIQYSSSAAVCTGQLSFLKPKENMFSNDFIAQINRHNEEIDQFLRAQAEQLGRTLAEKLMKNYKSLLVAAEESATKLIKRKEEELERATSLTLELEKRLAQLEMESSSLQAKAISEQSNAIALYAQLQHATAAAELAAAEDAQSACEDTDRKTYNTNALTCRSCRMRPVSMLLLPCRHVSLCDECCVCVGVKACPVCDSGISDSVQIHVS